MVVEVFLVPFVHAPSHAGVQASMHPLCEGGLESIPDDDQPAGREPLASFFNRTPPTTVLRSPPGLILPERNQSPRWPLEDEKTEKRPEPMPPKWPELVPAADPVAFEP